MDRITQLRKQLAQEERVHEGRIAAAQEARSKMMATRRALVEAIHNVHYGSIVRDRKGNQYRVSEIEVKSYGQPDHQPWLYGNPRKKDGTFGNARRAVYSNWTINEADQPKKEQNDKQ